MRQPFLLRHRPPLRTIERRRTRQPSAKPLPTRQNRRGVPRKAMPETMTGGGYRMPAVPISHTTPFTATRPSPTRQASRRSKAPRPGDWRRGFARHQAEPERSSPLPLASLHGRLRFRARPDGNHATKSGPSQQQRAAAFCRCVLVMEPGRFPPQEGPAPGGAGKALAKKPAPGGSDKPPRSISGGAGPPFTIPAVIAQRKSGSGRGQGVSSVSDDRGTSSNSTHARQGQSSSRQGAARQSDPTLETHLVPRLRNTQRTLHTPVLPHRTARRAPARAPSRTRRPLPRKPRQDPGLGAAPRPKAPALHELQRTRITTRHRLQPVPRGALNRTASPPGSPTSRAAAHPERLPPSDVLRYNIRER